MPSAGFQILADPIGALESLMLSQQPQREGEGVMAHPDEGADDSSGLTLSPPSGDLNSRSGINLHRDYVKISVPGGRRDPLPMEWWKTAIAFIYAAFNLILTTVVITVVHERVPAKENSPPLPDKFFDYIDRVKWAFSVTEINGMILVGIWGIQWIFLKYK